MLHTSMIVFKTNPAPAGLFGDNHIAYVTRFCLGLQLLLSADHIYTAAIIIALLLV